MLDLPLLANMIHCRNGWAEGSAMLVLRILCPKLETNLFNSIKKKLIKSNAGEWDICKQKVLGWQLTSLLKNKHQYHQLNEIYFNFISLKWNHLLILLPNDIQINCKRNLCKNYIPRMMCVALLIIKASNSVIFWLLVLVAYRSTTFALHMYLLYEGRPNVCVPGGNGLILFATSGNMARARVKN